MRTDPGLQFSDGFAPGGLNLPGRHFQDGVSQSGSERNHFFLSTGESFVDVGAISGADSIADGRAVALLDFDRDGWLDLALANANAPLFELYRNQLGDRTSAGAGFVALRLVGGNREPGASQRWSNRDGYGALVEIGLGERTLVREHRAGEGLAAQNSATMLVGVGSASEIDAITVRWPSGVSTEVRGVPVGSEVTIYEDPSVLGSQFSLSRYGAVTAPPAAELERSIERARAYFATIETVDPSWIGLFGYMRRRFGLEIKLASGELAHEVRGATARLEVYEIYRRIDDPSASVEKRQIADLPHVVDRITASALHCDRIALPAEWPEILGKASRAGGYALTHAALATQWTIERRCYTRAALGELRGRQIELLHELVRRRGAGVESDIDLWVEAVAMLDYLGSKVEPTVTKAILAVQRPDGGWPRARGARGSDPHASALALWALMAQRGPIRDVPWLR